MIFTKMNIESLLEISRDSYSQILNKMFVEEIEVEQVKLKNEDIYLVINCANDRKTKTFNFEKDCKSKEFREIVYTLNREMPIPTISAIFANSSDLEEVKGLNENSLLSKLEITEEELQKRSEDYKRKLLKTCKEEFSSENYCYVSEQFGLTYKHINLLVQNDYLSPEKAEKIKNNLSEDILKYIRLKDIFSQRCFALNSKIKKELMKIKIKKTRHFKILINRDTEDEEVLPEDGNIIEKLLLSDLSLMRKLKSTPKYVTNLFEYALFKDTMIKTDRIDNYPVYNDEDIFLVFLLCRHKEKIEFYNSSNSSKLRRSEKAKKENLVLKYINEFLSFPENEEHYLSPMLNRLKYMHYFKRVVLPENYFYLIRIFPNSYLYKDLLIITSENV